MNLRSILATSAVCAASAAFATGGVTGDTTFGILKLTDNVHTNLLISVPWTDCESGNVLVSNLVMTTNLKAGDTLIVKKNDGYYGWMLGGSPLVWETFQTVSTGEEVAGVVLQAPDPAKSRIERGDSLMLIRTQPNVSTNIYFYGRYDSSLVSRQLNKGVMTLVGNPGTDGNSFNLKDLSSKIANGGAANGDKVIINNKTYTFKSSYKGNANVWTYTKKADEQVGGLDIAETVVVGDEGVEIPAGQGFWYKRANSAANTTINFTVSLD